VPDESGVG
jgi:hypothetical protein